MAFPVLESTASSVQATSVTSHPITIPSGSVGDLLIVVFTLGNNAFGTADQSAFWDEYFVGASFSTGSGGERVHIFWRFADNSNDALTVTSTSTINSNAVVYRISGAAIFTLGIRYSGGNGVLLADSDQGAVESFGGSQDNLLLAVRVADGVIAPTDVPTGFTSVGNSVNSTLSRIDWATKNDTTDLYTGGAWTSTAARYFTASICVSPTVPATYTYEISVDDEEIGSYTAYKSLGILADSFRGEFKVVADPSLVKYRGLGVRVVSNGPGGVFHTIPRSALRFNVASRVQVRGVFRLADTWDNIQTYISPISTPFTAGTYDTGIFFDGANSRMALTYGGTGNITLLTGLQNSDVVNILFEIEDKQIVRGKAWLQGTAEPVGWTAEYDNTTPLTLSDLGVMVRLDNNGNDNWYTVSYTSYGFDTDALDPVVEILPATVDSTTGSPATTSNVAFAGGTGTAYQWTSDGSITFATPGYVYYLVVGGGGGGGASGAFYGSGGGGGGGFLQGVVPVKANVPYSITVGAGGVAPDGVTTTVGGVGGNSSFNSLVAFGGGGGAGVLAATAGGSGGGGSSRNASVTLNGAANIDGQGFDGGDGYVDTIDSLSIRSGGGGGGAGGLGGDADSVTGNAGNGGIGLQSSITGVATYYAGGGGGGSTYITTGGGLGGLGGGGDGENLSGRVETAGVDGLGGGGGGESRGNSDPGVAGGSGVVIVYTIDLPQEIVYSTSATNIITNVFYNGKYGTVYEFTTDGDIVFSGTGTIQYLVAGAGGSGGGTYGSQPGGGGGGGQVKTGSAIVNSGRYFVRIGTGGAAVGQNAAGLNGTASDIVLLDSSIIGGEASGGFGGQRGSGTSGETGIGGTSGSGFVGGAGGDYTVAGGGGGASAVGQDAVSPTLSGSGGAGVQSSISGTLLGYGGGGGGGSYNITTTQGLGTDGGGDGGRGDNGNAGASAIAATAGVRGGGGGGAIGGTSTVEQKNSGAGSDGIVVMFVESPASGGIKVWMGSDWQIKPLKYWNDTAWVVKPLKYWDSNAWRTTP